MRDFVTYSAAEFHPGPSLNMVIGPNGTGKSTLVCAICLGLGSKPEHLGRAKDLSEFVKHGAREAEIEIELAGDPSRHRQNPVVKRNIKREGNKSSYFIDGRPATQKAVTELTKSFHIQIDNLCQFLPQDRVVEFAALSPIDLLTQTLRAAAPEQMIDWHNELKQLRKEQKEGEADQQTQADILKQLEGRQTLQRGDVERLRERADLLERIKVLEKIRPFPAYRVARLKTQEIRDKKNAAEADLRRLEQEVAPALEAVNAKQAYVGRIDKVVASRKKIVERSEKQAGLLSKKQDELVEKIKECTQGIDAEREGSKKHRSDRARIEGQIRDLKKQSEQAPVDFDPAQYNEKNREFTRQLRDLEDRAEECNTRQRECINQASSLKQRIENAHNDLQSLQSQLGQQTNKLRGSSRDAAAAWQWIQANRDRFNAPVYGPPIIECSVKNPRHAKFVESVLQAGDLLAFTVTNSEDFKMLQQELYGNQKLHDINIRSAQKPMSEWPAPAREDEMRRLGLDTWIVDLLEGPEPVLSMLCDNRSIHQTGVAFRDINNAQYETLTQSAISSFVTPTEAFQITRRREYGPGATSTRTTKLKEAKFFTNQPIDTQAEQELNAKIREWRRDIQELEDQARTHKEQAREYGVQHKDCKDKQKQLQEEKEERQKAYAYRQSLPTKIRGLEEKQATLDEAMASFRSRVEAIEEDQAKLTLEKGQEALNYANTVATLQRLHIDLFEAELMLIEARSDLDALSRRNAEINTMLEQRRREVRAVAQEYERARGEAHELLSMCQEILQAETEDGLENERRIREEQPEGQSPEELENEIESTRARLEMVHEGNPAIIEEFERRGRKIEETRAKLARYETRLGGLEAQIAEIRSKWEPQLDGLIAHISEAFGENFARIGCAGQVGVYKDDDFEQWAVQIRVKFRENEPLSILDNHRQSGGERAVSTIFYLMALQSLARAPFRVVDEINQGMDPRNERSVLHLSLFTHLPTSLSRIQC